MAYMLLTLPSLVRLTPSITEWLLGAPFFGSRRQPRPPSRELCVYSAFWLLTFAIKLAFDYFMLDVPLVEPTRKLWQVDLYSLALQPAATRLRARRGQPGRPRGQPRHACSTTPSGGRASRRRVRLRARGGALAADALLQRGADRPALDARR